ncbi:hypothetical protein C8R46DRAFT_88500 [Mycena filopes]|nr:hypothetical protein C8R46DRAFT_88500 [Mycena filopes]
MSVLRQAGALPPNPLDYDSMDYVNQLREGILEAYTGLVSGFKGTDKVSVLLPYVDSILELIHRCSLDEERTDAQMKLSFGLIGDLAEALQGSPQMKQMLLKPWIVQEPRTSTACRKRRTRPGGGLRRTSRPQSSCSSSSTRSPRPPRTRPPLLPRHRARMPPPRPLPRPRYRQQSPPPLTPPLRPQLLTLPLRLLTPLLLRPLTPPRHPVTMTIMITTGSARREIDRMLEPLEYGDAVSTTATRSKNSMRHASKYTTERTSPFLPLLSTSALVLLRSSSR